MSTPHDDTLLIFRIDCIPCAVPATSVQGIVMPPERLTQPPGSDRGRPGIFRHAGHIYTIVDLRQRFGIDTPRRGAGRLLLHESGPRRHALQVDEVVELAASTQGQRLPLPPYLPRHLFHSGFLYRKEIVLCSTLEDLLAMHDNTPIRRHLEGLRRNAESTPLARTTTEIADRAPSHPEMTGKPVVAAQAPTPPQAPEIPRVTPHIKPTPHRTAHTPARPHITPNSKRSALPLSRAVAPPRQMPSITTSPPATVATKAKSDGGRRWLSGSLLALLALSGVGLGLGQLFESTGPSPHLNSPASTAPAVIQPLPVTAPAEPTPQPEPLPPITVTPPTAVANNSHALTVEEDEEGTIQLIIQRDQLRRPITAKETALNNGSETGGRENNRPESEEITSEQDTDWPTPAALPEPCDCTHIVKRGDTLWDIAQHYTNNAFYYPELARQSGIHNPHRIYPGNKVRIIVR